MGRIAKNHGSGLSGADRAESEHMPVPAVGRTFDILNLLANSGEPLSLREIHTRLALPKTSVFSILNSLQMCGIVTKQPNGTYAPGMRLYTLGMAVRMEMERSRIFLPRLEALRDQTGCTIFLSLLDDGELVVWEKVEGHEAVYFKAYVGERKRLNTSSAGKAIAAYLSDEDLDYALSKGMDALTEKTITDPEALRRDLVQTRERGYAIDDEEGQLGIYCIGVPVFDGQGKVFGAVSISTLKSDLLLERVETYIGQIQRAAKDLSRLC